MIPGRALLFLGFSLALANAQPVYSDEWMELRQNLFENRQRLVSEFNFCLKFALESQSLILDNEFTLPITKSSYLLATDGEWWRYSEVDLKKGGGFFSVEANNELRTRDERLIWSATGVVTDGSEGSYIQGLEFLDFLSFDIGSAIEESGFLKPRSRKDLALLKYQLPQPDLVKTIDIARSTPGAEIRHERIGDLECVTVAYGIELVSVCPALNYALVQRKARFPDTNIIKFHLRCSDFFSPGRGLYVPRRVEQDVYAKFSENTQIHNHVVGTVSYQLKKFTIGQTSQQLFEPSFPHGFFISDFVRGINYQYAADNRKPFGKGAKAAKQIIDENKDQRVSRNATNMAIVITIGIAAISALILLRKRERKS